MTERMTTKYRRAYADRLGKNRLRDSKSIELRRTVTNSSAPKSWSKCFENPMNYEQRSKSIELDRTVTPDFTARDITQNEKEDSYTEGYEENVVKKLKKELGRSHVRGWDVTFLMR